MLVLGSDSENSLRIKIYAFFVITSKPTQLEDWHKHFGLRALQVTLQ